MEITLVQSNKLTQSRYNFSVVEKRAVYFIIKEVRKQFIEQKGQRDLFSDLILKISTESLRGSDSVLRDVYSALRSLRKKDIFLEDEDQVLCVGYINYFRHKKKDGHVEVQVSKTILPYMVELAEQFTTYKLTVAISLKNKYSQRFYEYCSQFKATGFFYVSIEDLRKKLMIENAYPRYALLKQKVLEPAKKELKNLYDAGQCDVCFNYSEDKTGRTVNGLKIVVKSKDNEMEQLKPEDYLFYIRTWLNSWLNTSSRPKNKIWVDTITKHLQLNPDLMPKLHDRLVRMQEKEPVSNYAALARHIVEEDFLS